MKSKRKISSVCFFIVSCSSILPGARVPRTRSENLRISQNFKKKQACKPGSVEPTFRQASPIIYLDLASLQDSSNLPSGIERAALMLRFIWSFNSQGLPILIVANQYRELLPHIFTLTILANSGFFLWHFAVSILLWILPVRKWDALCCPDFPLRIVTKR